jgi:hypothetical protein
MIVFRPRPLQTASRLCPKSIRRGVWKNWTKLRKMDLCTYSFFSRLCRYFNGVLK